MRIPCSNTEYERTYGSSTQFKETLQADCVQSRQAGFIQRFLKGGLMHKLCVVLPYHFSGGYHQ